MTSPRRHRIFGNSLMGMAGVLIALSISIPAGAAISNGPNLTNSTAAEEQRILQFHQAEQSYQEKLKVGRERYNQKQVNRAKIIAAMSSELQARQQAVVIQPLAAPDGNADEPVSSFQYSFGLAVLAIGLISFGLYRHRQRALDAFGQKRQPISDLVP
jgi:hypothetical protein